MNNQNNLNYYIDATNEFIGGGGGIFNNDETITSNIIIAGDGGSNLSDYIYTRNTSNLYLNNPHINGDIIFTNLYTLNDAYTYRDGEVRINKFGKLEVFHRYSLLNPTVISEWKDVDSEIAGLITSSQLSGLEMIAVQAQLAAVDGLVTSFIPRLNDLDNEVGFLIAGITEDDVIKGSYDSTKKLFETSYNEELALAASQDFANKIRINSATRIDGLIQTFVVGGGIAGIMGAIYAANNTKTLNNVYSNLAYSNSDYKNLPAFDGDLVTSNYDYYEVEQFREYQRNFRLLNDEIGTINSNVLTKQQIPILNTNKITIGNITTPNSAFNLESTGDININELYRNSVSLTSTLNTKQGNLTFNNPLLNTTNIITLKKDSSLTLDDSGNLSVATETSSKWTTNGTSIYNSSLNGNIGIGITNPTSYLHLHKTGANQDVRISMTDGTTAKTLNDGFQIIKATNENGYIWNYENYPIRFGTNNSERLTILENGSIGINNNSPSSSYKLDIGGNVNLSSTNDYYRNGVSLTTTLGTKQDNLTFTQPLNNTTNTISLNYDSTLALSGNNLGVATSTKSKWAKVASPYPAIDDIYNLNVRNVGIGTNMPSVKLDVNGDFTCRGTCSINYNENDQAYFAMINNYQGANANVRFLFNTYSTSGTIDLFNALHATTPDLLKINNSLGDIMIANGIPHPYIYLNRSSGNIGIGKTNPSYRLDVNGSLKSLSLNTGSLTSGYIDCLGMTTNNVNITAGLGSVYSANLFLNNREIQNHLFNNNGRAHLTFNNFNTPTDFGCHFIAGTTNSPNIAGISQYYSMTLGLGNQYYSGSPDGNYRLQLAIPRTTDAYPYLCSRAMENGSWGGWTKIRSGYSDSAVESGKTYEFEPYIDMWHHSRADNINRFYFNNGSSTDFGTGNGYNFKHATDGTDLFTIFGSGWIKARMQAVTDSGTDYLGVQVNTTATGGTWFETIKIMYGSFTGFHRFFCDDPLLIKDNEDTMNDFKNEFIGRVVVSTGKIKTHSQNKSVGETEEPWFILEDKAGITIENSHCVVRLSNKKKDKTVIGVIGLNRNNSAPDRIIVNGVGEGAVWVVNTNGNLILNGDLLQTSSLLGYAEKQVLEASGYADDIIRNYTIGKVMIDCDFELDSPYYKCEVIEGGYRRAFLACVYYCS